jgi:uncharacterized RDD family membrane protein YckC
MITSSTRLSWLALFAVCGLALAGHALPVRAETPPPADLPVDADQRDDSDRRDITSKGTDFDDDVAPAEPAQKQAPIARHGHGHRSRSDGRHDIFSLFEDVHADSGERVRSLTSIFGSAQNDGTADNVVSVFGNVHSDGAIESDAVSVFGSTYIDNTVGGDITAVFGNVVLGPHADVSGDVNSVFGRVKRDPAATVNGGLNTPFGHDFSGHFSPFSNWLHECLREGRLLGFGPGLSWTWAVALVFLGMYAVLALLFPVALQQCVRTLDTRPGQVFVTALLTMLCTPVLIALLFVTIIGIAAVPFVLFALFLMSLFGKAVVLAWIGERVLNRRPVQHVAIAVLIGGVVVSLAYLVPVLGILVYKILGIFGLGTVVYSLLSNARARSAGRPLAAGAAPGSSVPASAGAAPEPITAPYGSGGFGTAAAAVGASAAAGATYSAPGAAAGAGGGAGGVPPGGPSSGAAASGASGPGAPRPGAPGPGASNPGGSFFTNRPHATAMMPRAGFWIRMGALLLDVLLVAIVGSLFEHNFSHDFHVVLLAIYGAVMWKLRGSTIGGIACDLQVVRLDGREIDWETSIVRALSCFLSLAALGLGFIWIAFDENGQAWHDKIAGTVVVRVPKGAPVA